MNVSSPDWSEVFYGMGMDFNYWPSFYKTNN